MIIIRPNEDDEATSLQKISYALSHPTSYEPVYIKEGPISFAIASAFEELLLSNNYEKRWDVHLTTCYPEDEEAYMKLSHTFFKAFKHGRIGELTLIDLDSTNDRGHRDMLLSVFGMTDANNDNRCNQQSSLKLNLDCCVFETSMLSLLQSWTRDVASTVSELVIQGDCFRWPDTPTTTECIAKMFERARTTPIDLKFWNVSVIGDMEYLQDWNLQFMLAYGRSCLSMSGLSAIAPSVKRLKIGVDEHLDISLTEAGIIALLEHPNCCLEYLRLCTEVDDENESFQNACFQDEAVVSLFQTLSKNSSLRHLEISQPRLDDPRIWHGMIEYLRANPPLKELCIENLSISAAAAVVSEICHVLSSENHTLEHFLFDCYSIDTDNRTLWVKTRKLEATIHPYLVRNQAGRRILLDRQASSSLMTEVIGRIQQMEISTISRIIGPKETLVLRADATYHLVREGLGVLFSSRDYKRHGMREFFSTCWMMTRDIFLAK